MTFFNKYTNVICLNNLKRYVIFVKKNVDNGEGKVGLNDSN